MIYCVIPRELEADLFDRMVEYYRDNPNVTVILDQRRGPTGARQGEGRQAGDQRPPPRPRAGNLPETPKRGNYACARGGDRRKDLQELHRRRMGRCRVRRDVRVHEPCDGEVSALSRVGPEDVDRAVAAAKDAYEDVAARARAEAREILFRFAHLVTSTRTSSPT